MDCTKCGKQIDIMAFNGLKTAFTLYCKCGHVWQIPVPRDANLTIDQMRCLLNVGWTPPREQSKLEKAIEEIKAQGIAAGTIATTLTQAIKNMEAEINETLRRR